MRPYQRTASGPRCRATGSKFGWTSKGFPGQAWLPAIIAQAPFARLSRRTDL